MNMHITRFVIQGFRSFRDVTFEPRPLSVLVGANNAGKTNLVAAIDLLEDIYSQGVLRPFGRRGGFQLNAYRPVEGDRTTTMSFQIEVSVPAGEIRTSRSGSNGASDGSSDLSRSVSIDLKHWFSLAEASSFSDDELRVDAESIEISASANSRIYPIATFTRESPSQPEEHPVPTEIVDDDLWSLCFGSHRTKGLFGAMLSPGSIESGPTDLLINKLRFLLPVVDHTLERLAEIRLYQLTASEARQPSPRLAGGRMQATGEGLPGLVRFLERREPDAWRSVLEALFQVAPSLEDVSVDDEYDGRLTLRFFEWDRKRPWTSTEISDGTIRALAILSALNDHRSLLDLIEEPENSLHPWAIRAFVDACRRAVTPAHVKQLVVTTHSPILLDYVEPADIFVLWREKDGSHIAPLLTLDPDAHRLWEQGDTTLSDLVDSGWLREAVPGGIR